jgi:hypothetical protein
MNNPEKQNDLLSALVGLKKVAGTTAAPRVEIIPEQSTSWDDKALKTSKGAVVKTNVADWNKADFRKYIARKYMDKYTQMLQMPIAQAYKTLTDMEVSLEKNTGQKCTPLMMKDYIDYVFDRHVDTLIQKEGFFGVHKLSRPALVLAYAKANNFHQQSQIGHSAPPAPIAAPQKEEDITLDDLQGAYRIHSRHFVSTYGIVLPVNYLMYVKKKSKEEAIQYVVSAVAKLSSDIQPIVEATTKNGPYPTWFEFLDASQIIKGLKVITSSESNRFGFLKV